MWSRDEASLLPREGHSAGTDAEGDNSERDSGGCRYCVRCGCCFALDLVSPHRPQLIYIYQLHFPDSDLLLCWMPGGGSATPAAAAGAGDVCDASEDMAMYGCVRI